MSKGYLTLFLILLVVGALGKFKQQSKCRPHPPYTQSALTLSWPGQFCHNPTKCTDDFSSWDGHSFGIHGYWPSYDSDNIDCVKMGKRPDPYCQDHFIFNERLLSDLQPQLEQVWPQWGASNSDTFHQNEWYKHGVCYLKLNKERYGDKYNDDQLFHSYFAGSIAKAVKHNQVSKFVFQNKEQLAAELKIQSVNHFYTDCRRGFISEVRICYDLGVPGKEKQIDCFDRNLAEELYRCKYPLRLHQKVGQEQAEQN